MRLMRRISLLIAVYIIAVVSGQDETGSDVFELPPTLESQDFVGASDFVGRTEEINEGSDSFVISTAMVEPLTETIVTTVTPKQEERTIEPLVLTTTNDKNRSDFHRINALPPRKIPQPLPDEATGVDPFSSDEPVSTSTKADETAVAPEVPVIHATNDTIETVALQPLNDSMPVMNTTEESMLESTTVSVPHVPVIQPALEGRVLKEKVEDLPSTEKPIVELPFSVDSGAPETLEATTPLEEPERKKEQFMIETTAEPERIPVTEAETTRIPVTEAETTFAATVVAVNASAGNESTTHEMFVPTTTSEETLIEMKNVSEVITTTATILSSSSDDEAVPFDQDKLSGLFEQDGSFIPEHLINQPSSEPAFPRVELPEESAEIINGRVKPDDNTGAHAIDSVPVTVISEIQDTTPSTTTTSTTTPSHPPAIIYQPIVTKTTINEFFHVGQTHGSIPSEERPADHETALLSTSTSTATPSWQSETAPELKPEPQPQPEPSPEVSKESTATTTRAFPESKPEAQQEPQDGVRPVLQPEPQPEPHPEPRPDFPPEPRSESQPKVQFGMQPEPQQETQPAPQLDPHAVPEPSPVPRAEQTPVLEHTLEPTPQPQPEPEPVPEPEPEPVPAVHSRPSVPHPEPEPEPEPAADNLKKSTLTMRITSIEFMEEFNDMSSGKYRKLSDQIIPEVSAILKTLLGDNFVGFDITSLVKGSVIINGVILTRQDIPDAEELATKIEAAISSNGSMIGQNEVDLRSISVNGIPSRAYVEQVHSTLPQSPSPSALLIGSIIAVGVLVILIVAFIVIALNNRRSNGSMKLKADAFPRVENGKASYTNPQAVSVNLMSYGNGTAGTPATQGQMMTSLSVNPNEREVC